MKPWQRVILTASVVAGVTGCGVARNAEVGYVIEKQDLPDEKALYITLDADTTNADRKLFFDDADMAPFYYMEPGDRVKYTNRKKCRFVDIGYGDRVLRVNGERMAKLRRYYER